MKFRDVVYSGATNDLLLMIETVARKCNEEDLKEVSIIGYISNHQFEVRVKR